MNSWCRILVVLCLCVGSFYFAPVTHAEYADCVDGVENCDNGEGQGADGGGGGDVTNETFTTTITYETGTLEGPTGGIVPCSGVDCETCKFVELLNKVISFIILFMLVLIALLAAINGFKLVTSGGNQSQYSEAKSSLTNILIGIIIMLSSWLIIDTIMKAFLKNNGQVQWDESENGWGPWNQIQCTTIIRGKETDEAWLPGSTNLSTTTVEEVIAYSELAAQESLASAANLPSGGVCNPDYLAGFGFTGRNLDIARCVLEGESACGSNLNTKDLTSGQNIPFSVGIWQINTTWHEVENCPGVPTLICHDAWNGHDYSATLIDDALYKSCSDALSDANCATINAERIARTRGWTQWSAYTNNNCNAL